MRGWAVARTAWMAGISSAAAGAASTARAAAALTRRDIPTPRHRPPYGLAPPPVIACRSGNSGARWSLDVIFLGV